MPKLTKRGRGKLTKKQFMALAKRAKEEYYCTTKPIQEIPITERKGR